jgi:hypothetical protein
MRWTDDNAGICTTGERELHRNQGMEEDAVIMIP